MAKYLTERQKEILEFIRDSLRRRGISPTHREICEHFGYSSYGTVHKHLKLLESKGYLRRHWNQKRGVELVDPSPSTGSNGSEGGAGATRELPFLGLIAAGKPIDTVATDERVEVPAHLVDGRAHGHFVLRVEGHSMIEEGIHDGDLVVVQRQGEAGRGDMVVALVGDEVTLKRFFPEGETIRLQPANHQMKPIFVAATDVQVQGRVVGLMRRF